MQLINGISSDLRFQLRYFNGTAIKIPFSPSAAVSPNNSYLFLKDSKLSLSAISSIKLAASFLK